MTNTATLPEPTTTIEAPDQGRFNGDVLCEALRRVKSVLEICCLDRVEEPQRLGSIRSTFRYLLDSGRLKAPKNKRLSFRWTSDSTALIFWVPAKA